MSDLGTSALAGLDMNPAPQPPRRGGPATVEDPTLIDDSTASLYFSEIDSAPEAERQARLDALEKWADSRLTQQREDQYQQEERMFLDMPGWWKEEGNDDVPDAAKMEIANRRFIAWQHGKTPDSLREDYASARDIWTLDQYGKTGLSEEQTYDLIQKGVQSRKTLVDNIGKIGGDVTLALYNQLATGQPVDVPRLVQNFKDANADKIKDLPKGWEKVLLEAAAKQHQEKHDLLRDHAATMRTLRDHLVSVTGRMVQGAEPPDVTNDKDVLGMVDSLAAIPEEARHELFGSLLSAAETAGMEEKGFWQMAGEAFPRAVNLFRNTPETFNEIHAANNLKALRNENLKSVALDENGMVVPYAEGAMGGQALIPLSDEERKKLAADTETQLKRATVVAELKDIADNRFDPVRATAKNPLLRTGQGFFLGGPQALAYSAAAMVPYAGPYLVATSIFSNTYQGLRRDGLSPGQAAMIAAPSAALETASEMLEAKVLFGKSKIFEDALLRIANPARTGRLARAGARFAGGLVWENAMEGGQDFITPTIQDVAHALDQTIPDIDWGTQLDQWWDQRLETLGATLMPILAGGLVVQLSEGKLYKDANLRRELYLSTGATQKDIEYFENAPTPEERDARYREFFAAATDETRARAKAHIQGRIEESAKVAQADSIPQIVTTTDPTTGEKRYSLRDGQNNERFSTSNYDTALSALNYYLQESGKGGVPEAVPQLLQSEDGTYSIRRNGVVTHTNLDEDAATKQLADAAIRNSDIFLHTQIALMEHLSSAAKSSGQTSDFSLEDQNVIDQLANMTPEQLAGRIADWEKETGQKADGLTFATMGLNTVEKIKEDLYRSVSKIVRADRPEAITAVVEEHAEGHYKTAIRTGRLTEDTAIQWLRDYEGKTGDSILREGFDNLTPDERSRALTEAMSSMSVSHFLGNANKSALAPRFLAFLEAMAEYLRAAFARAAVIKKAIAKGQIGQDFQTYLAQSVGFDVDGAVAEKATEAQKEMLGVQGTTASIAPVSAKTLRDALPKRDLPVALLNNPTAQEAFAWWEENMVGREIQTPIGLKFTPNPGHFFRFVARKDGDRKGFVDGFGDNPNAVQEALRSGQIDARQISGWEDFRAKNLPIIPDLMESPDFVLAQIKPDDRVTIYLIKRYANAFSVVGFATEGNTFAPLSFFSNKLSNSFLEGSYLVHLSQQMKEETQSLPAIPKATASSWQAQDLASLLRRNYPQVSGLVNTDLGTTLSIAPAQDHLATIKKIEQASESVINPEGQRWTPPPALAESQQSSDVGSITFSIGVKKMRMVDNWTTEESVALEGLLRMAELQEQHKQWLNAKGGNIRSIARLNQWLRGNRKAVAEIRKTEAALGGKLRLLDERDQLIPLPIEAAKKDTGNGPRYERFSRALPQLFLDRMDAGLFTAIHRKINRAMERAWENKGEMEPTPMPVGLRGRKGAKMSQIRNEESELFVQTPIRDAEKTVAALNLNSACPQFVIGNRGCWGDACYLTQMARGATGTNLFERAMYTGEILQWNDEEIREINKTGGLRVNGVGDTTLDNVAQLEAVIRHAALRGLKLKMITKQELSIQTLAALARSGQDISHVQVQPSLDYYWRPVEMDLDETNSGARDIAGGDKARIDALLDGDNADLMQAVYDQFGRAVRKIDGKWYRKDGFTWQQFHAMRFAYPEVQMIPRVIVGSVSEIIDAATRHPGSIITLMHGKLGDGIISEFSDTQYNFLSARHEFAWDKAAGKIRVFADTSRNQEKLAKKNEWLKNPKPLKKLSLEASIEKVKRSIAKLEGSLERQTKGHLALENHINDNYTKAQRLNIYNNLKQQTCCQDNDSADACADCASHCAMRQILTAKQAAKTEKLFPLDKPGANEDPEARVSEDFTASIAPQQDSDYLAAVERGDMETANITYSIAPAQFADLEAAMAKIDADPAFRRERVAATLKRMKAIKRQFESNPEPLGQIEAIAQMEAVIGMLPPEARGKIGGFRKLANYKTPKGRLNYIKNRIKEVDAAMEEYLRGEFLQNIANQLEGAQPKVGENKIVTGKLGPQAQRIADMVLEATTLDADETSARMDDVERRLGNPDTDPNEISNLLDRWSVLNLFGDLDNRTALELDQARTWLRETLTRGRNAWRMVEEARRAEYKAVEDEITETMKSSGLTTRTKIKPTEIAEQFLLGHLSFIQLLRSWMPQHKWLKNLEYRIALAEQAKDMAIGKAARRMRDAVKAALQSQDKSSGNMAVDKALHALQQQRHTIKTVTSTKRTNRRIEISKVEQMLAGTVGVEALGLTAADRFAAKAALDALTPQQRARRTFLEWTADVPSTFEESPISQDQAIQFLLSYDQTDVAERMERQGWSSDVISQLEEMTSDPVSQAVMKFLRAEYAAQHKRANPIYRAMFGIDMPQVENYAPTRYQHAADTADLSPLGSAIESSGMTPGSFKRRQNHNAKMRTIGAIEVFNQNLAMMEHWIALAEINRDIRGVFMRPKLRDALKATFGEPFHQLLNTQIDALTRGGSIKAQDLMADRTVVSALIGGKSIASLGFNLLTIGAQVDSFMRGAYHIGLGKFFRALMSRDTLKNIPKAWHSDTVQRRIVGGSNPQVRYVFESARTKPSQFLDLAKKSMLPMQYTDAWLTTVTSAIVFTEHYNAAKQAGATDAMAEKVATDEAAYAVYNYSQPIDIANRSPRETMGGLWTRAIMLFMSDARLRSALFLEAGKVAKKDPKRAANIVATTILMTLVGQTIRNLLKDATDDDPDDEVWTVDSYARSLMLAPTNGIFLFNAVAAKAYDWATGAPQFGQTGNIILDQVSLVQRAVKNAEATFDLDDPDAMLKQWDTISRAIAVTPAMASPAVIINLLQTVRGTWNNIEEED